MGPCRLGTGQISPSLRKPQGPGECGCLSPPPLCRGEATPALPLSSVGSGMDEVTETEMGPNVPGRELTQGSLGRGRQLLSNCCVGECEASCCLPGALGSQLLPNWGILAASGPIWGWGVRQCHHWVRSLQPHLPCRAGVPLSAFGYFPALVTMCSLRKNQRK